MPVSYTHLNTDIENYSEFDSEMAQQFADEVVPDAMAVIEYSSSTTVTFAPVSYTHLVYVVNCFSMKNTHICGLCESCLFCLGLHIR